MKPQLSALLLTLLAGKAMAFQAQVAAPQPAQTNSAENAFEGRFYGFHAMDMQAVSLGSCSTQPVAGCQCGFCTLLRHAGSAK
ncbi:hypothetical protein [Serratia odorifera]|uniref:Uncharacterized protein n=2 Tax=Serratia odorifera TaxID=618 RepID=D4E4A2_SEROD|nr:hypothetical protein [Serratia odorifera]EFE95311.1 hypothetical protein HMPREF0758_3002 [Serratia odorifera DSM 4582]PNK90070.1 hypothetical protein CEQ31_010305 [Serratia odorifera]RII71055.1 hypothetical protein DX901_16015 [Serratia odorifera]VDZ61059.1 Uncharacterised protein [Serratia odorifera]